MSWAKDHEIKGEIGTMLFLQVQPGASKTGFKGIHASEPPRLKISVQAPPVEGAANEAVTKFLAQFFQISASRVFLISGQSSRLKNFWLEGLSHAEVFQKISPVLSAK